jgi:hypothetical protein
MTAQVDAEIGASVARAVAAERERLENEAARAVAAERERLENEAARAVAAERERLENEAARAVAAERERLENEAARVSGETRRRLAESLNQRLRRIRQTSTEHEALQLLLEESTAWAQRAVVLLIENNQARVAASRPALHEDDAVGAPIELSTAAAIASCVESRDPVVALGAPAEVSPVLASALRLSPDDKAYLFPVAARQRTVAVMIACGGVTPAPIELLCEAVGMKLESLDIPGFEVTGAGQVVNLPDGVVAMAASLPLVQIAGAQNAAQNAAPNSARTEDAPATWSKLTQEDQALHLRAQRTARVRVAQIRISESEALRKGLQAGDIYGALRPAIDAARDEYRQAYSSKTPTMVDYLHLEVLRSLAHEDSRLLGKDYPGQIA